MFVRDPLNSLGNRHASSKRFKTIVEISKKNTYAVKKATQHIFLNNLQFTKLSAKFPSCSFCGDTSHRVTNFSVKYSFEKEQKAYSLSEHLLKRALYRILSTDQINDVIYSNIGSSGNGTIHIAIHT